MGSMDVLEAFDQVAVEQPAILQRQLDDAGLPEAVQRSAQDDLTAALAGVRRALAGWHPVPAVTDPAEQAALAEKVGDLVADALGAVVAARVDQLHKTVSRTRKQLQDWNATRDALSAKLTREQRAALTDPDPTDYDTAEFEYLPDGAFRPRYHVKPEPAVVDFTRNRVNVEDKK